MKFNIFMHDFRLSPFHGPKIARRMYTRAYQSMCVKCNKFAVNERKHEAAHKSGF